MILTRNQIACIYLLYKIIMSYYKIKNVVYVNFHTHHSSLLKLTIMYLNIVLSTRKMLNRTAITAFFSCFNSTAYVIGGFYE